MPAPDVGDEFSVRGSRRDGDVTAPADQAPWSGDDIANF